MTCSFCGREEAECGPYFITSAIADAAICWGCVGVIIDAAERDCIEKQRDCYWGA